MLMGCSPVEESRGWRSRASIKAAEEAGYAEWVSFGGTSAGAIAAMALAVGYNADGLKELFSFDFSKIDDRGGPFGLGVMVNYFDHGLTQGKALTAWMGSMLEARAVKPVGSAPSVFGDLEPHAQGGRRRHRAFADGGVSRRRRQIPRPCRPGLDQENFPIATAVRISAGYPGFFPPIALKDEATGSEGALVDGGVSATFPVFLFDVPNPSAQPGRFGCLRATAPEKPPRQPDLGAAVADRPGRGRHRHGDQRAGRLRAHDRSGGHCDSDGLGVDAGLLAVPGATRTPSIESGYETAKQFFDAEPGGDEPLRGDPAGDRRRRTQPA